MILYVNLCADSRKKTSDLQKALQQNANIKAVTEYVYDLQALKKRIQAPECSHQIIIIELCRTSPISELLAHRNDLKKFSLVLRLRDITDNEQILQLFQLYPRYMSLSSDTGTILSVLENRLHDHRQKAKRFSRKRITREKEKPLMAAAAISDPA